MHLASTYGMRQVRVFGSVARGTERSDSDLDLLVDLPAGTGLFTLGRLRRELKEIVGAVVDLVPDDGLKPDVAERIRPDLVAL